MFTIKIANNFVEKCAYVKHICQIHFLTVDLKMLINAIYHWRKKIMNNLKNGIQSVENYFEFQANLKSWKRNQNHWNFRKIWIFQGISLSFSIETFAKCFWLKFLLNLLFFSLPKFLPLINVVRHTLMETVHIF